MNRSDVWNLQTSILAWVRRSVAGEALLSPSDPGTWCLLSGVVPSVGGAMGKSVAPRCTHHGIRWAALVTVREGECDQMKSSVGPGLPLS